MKLFETIAKTLPEGTDVTIVARKCGDSLTVSTAFRNNAVKDSAKEFIQPFIVTGTPAELDAEFAGLIAEPLEKSSGIQTSMAEFEASSRKAKAKSQALAEEKKKEDAEKKVRKENFLKHSEAAKKAKGEGDYKKAVSEYTEALKYADGTDKTKTESEIRACRQKDVPSMFDAFDEQEDERNSAADADAPGTEDEDPEETEEDAGEEDPLDVDFSDEL